MALALAASVYAQGFPRLDSTGRPGDGRPGLLEEIAPPPSPPEAVLPPPPVPEKETEHLPLASVFVRKLIVTGSTVFSPQEIDKVTGPYVNREITSGELESLRRALTLLYVDKGYVNSGAVIPDQTVVDGVITVQIVEGKLSLIDVDGNKWFGDAFIRDRVALGAGPPVNIAPLQERLMLLQQDERFQSIHAELKPGAEPGESVLAVKVEEKNPFFVWLAFNNYQPPSVGAEQGLVTLAHRSLTGRGDILSFTYGYADGLHPQIDAWYAIPITVRDTTLLLRYQKNDFAVVEEEFRSLDTKSKSNSYEVTLRHPVYRTLYQEFALGLTGEREHSKTYLLDDPFSFYPGVEDGESTVTVIRFFQEWVYRTQRQVIALRSRFSRGIDALGATTHGFGNVPDGEFRSWLGQFQWAQVLAPWDLQVLFRLDTQMSDDPLLPLEQIAVGGRYTVRGYPENLLVTDEALITSLEVRIPLVTDKLWAEYLHLAPFADYGRVNNVHLPTPDLREVYSAGLGLRWSAPLLKMLVELRGEAEIYWGYQLQHVNTPHNDLQYDGIHFQFVISGF